MIRVLALFPNTLEANEVDAILPKIITTFKEGKGLLSLNVSDGQLMSPDGPPAYSRVLEATFDSLDLFMAWAQSPEAEADNVLFEGKGIVRIFYEVVDA